MSDIRARPGGRRLASGRRPGEGEGGTRGYAADPSQASGACLILPGWPSDRPVGLVESDASTVEVNGQPPSGISDLPAFPWWLVNGGGTRRTGRGPRGTGNHGRKDRIACGIGSRV